MKLENNKSKNTVVCAINGIVKATKTELNFKIDIVCAVIVIALGFVFKINNYEWIAIVFAIGVMLCAELLNTAIETVVDMYTRQENEMAGKAKDIAAGAVLILAINVSVIGGIIFIPKIIDCLSKNLIV